VRSDAQMSSLTEALTSAKKEIETQSVRLRDLEAMLTEERRAREDAEERASRLERESIQEADDEDHEVADEEITADETDSSEMTTGMENGSASPDAADTTSRLQQRLDLMMSEMSEMKQQMERYRERAETAEADRKTLAEMIENIRRDNARTSSREGRRMSRTNSPTSRSVPASGTDGSEDGHKAEEGEITIINDNDLDEDGTEEILRRSNMTNGHAVEHDNEKSSANASNALVHRQLGRSDLMYHGGPVGAMVAVVAIGVAVMAMLNQYPKVER
jgi:hypothetical protein